MVWRFSRHFVPGYHHVSLPQINADVRRLDESRARTIRVNLRSSAVGFLRDSGLVADAND